MIFAYRWINTCPSHTGECNVQCKLPIISFNLIETNAFNNLLFFRKRLSFIIPFSRFLFCDRLFLISTISPNYNKVYSHKLTAFPALPFESAAQCILFERYKFRSKTMKNSSRRSSFLSGPENGALGNIYLALLVSLYTKKS